MAFIDDVRAQLIEEGVTTPVMLDYIDDRIAQIVSDKLSQAVADMEERLRADLGDK